MALTLHSQSPAEHRCGVGMGPLGSVRMGTPSSQAEHQQSTPPHPRPRPRLQGEVLLPTLTAPPPSKTYPQVLCGRGAQG